MYRPVLQLTDEPAAIHVGVSDAREGSERVISIVLDALASNS
jgi:hypothetical protein